MIRTTNFNDNDLNITPCQGSDKIKSNKKTINFNPETSQFTLSQPSDKITSNKSAIIKEVKEYKLFDNFQDDEFTYILTEWGYELETHKYFLESYKRFRNNKSNRTFNAITNILEISKETYLNSIKNANYKQAVANHINLDQELYIKLIEDILNNKIKLNDNIITPWCYKEVILLNKTYHSLIKVWNNEKLSTTDINALQIDEDAIIGE